MSSLTQLFVYIHYLSKFLTFFKKIPLLIIFGFAFILTRIGIHTLKDVDGSLLHRDLMIRLLV